MNAPAPLSRRQWLGRIALPAVAGSALTAVAATPVPPGAPTPPGTWNVRDFGAVGDGATLDTAAVQAAIDAAHAARGGTVVVPAGDFLVGTLELRSHVTLHLTAQGRLLGSPDIARYTAGRGVPPGNGNIVLLSASEAENIAIEGAGTIDGNGARFFTGEGDMTGPGQDSSRGYRHRPHLLIFDRCRRVRLEGVFLTASAYHCVRILRCEHVRFTGVRIHNRVNKNNDGFHFSSCRHVHVTDCDVACQDDACALFGSNQFVTVTGCTFSTRWSVFRFGGGEPRNITVSNCIISDTFGCPVKMRFGPRSVAENILFANLVLDRVTGPVSIGLDSRGRRPPGPGEEPPPRGRVRNIAFRGLRATVVAEGAQFADMAWEQSYRPGERHTCIVLNGASDDVLENISFTDVHVTFAGGGTAAEAARPVPEIAGEYFEIGPPPAWGLYARGVRGLTLDNVRLETAAPDARPAIVLDRVVDAGLAHLAVQGQPGAAATVRAHQARDTLIAGPRLLAPTPVFLQVGGPDSAGIRVDGGDLAGATRPFVLEPGVRPDAATWRA